MQVVARCRKCGKVMKSVRVDNYRVKMSCSCGFSDFRTMTERVKTVNPFFQKASFTPFLEDEKGKMVLTMQRANREHLEIISLEEISMLVSSDLELPQVLQQMALGASNAEIARRLYVPVQAVSGHVTRILEKLGLPDRQDAAVLARRSGLRAV